jgi:hypothetical protein
MNKIIQHVLLMIIENLAINQAKSNMCSLILNKLEQIYYDECGQTPNEWGLIIMDKSIN